MGSHHAILHDLEFPMETRMAFNSERCTRVYFSRDGIKGLCHSSQFVLLLKFSLLCIGYSVARALTCNPSASGTDVLGL